MNTIVLTDIDDTLTDHGKLTDVAYQALWDLHRGGIAVIPITGRPAGFCELIARFWPVSAVVGENGAFYFHYTQGEMKRWWHPELKSYLEHKAQFDRLLQEVQKHFPQVKPASDQFSRISDLAIDFAEDIKPPLSTDQALKIKQIAESLGFTAKVSSIHVNCYLGNFNKKETTLILLTHLFGLTAEEAKKSVYFVGDSPNDEPMFAFFEKSYGVANVIQFQSQLKHQPRHILKKIGGMGFAEFTSLLLGRSSFKD